MIVFGGSGPIHGARIARKLRIPRVVCPSGAGVMSAFGLLASPVGFELVQSLRTPFVDHDASRASTEVVGALEARVREQLASAGGDAAQSRVAGAARHALRRAGLRGRGAAARRGPGAGRCADLSGTLRRGLRDHLRHELRPTAPSRSSPGRSRCRGRCPAATRRTNCARPASPARALRGHRPAYFPELQRHRRCPVYDRYATGAGRPTLDGPALVEEAESTCVRRRRAIARISTTQLNLVIDIGGCSMSHTTPSPSASSGTG